MVFVIEQKVQETNRGSLAAQYRIVLGGDVINCKAAAKKSNSLDNTVLLDVRIIA